MTTISRRLVPSDLVAGLLGLLALAVIWRADHITGHDLGFSLFYLIPVLFVAARFGLPAGYAAATLAAAAWLSADLSAGQVYPHAAIGYWNAFIRFSFFVIGIQAMHLAESSGRECAAKEAAEESSKVKMGIAALIGIDFSRILASLQEAAAGLRKADLAALPQAAKTVEVVERAMSQIESASETLSKLHRMDSGLFSIELRRLDVRVLLRDALLVLQPLLQGKKIVVHADFWAGSRTMAAQEDEKEFTVLLSKLVGTALRYAGPGQPLTIRVSDESSHKERQARLVFETGTTRAAMKDSQLPGLGTEDQAGQEAVIRLQVARSLLAPAHRQGARALFALSSWESGA